MLWLWAAGDRAEPAVAADELDQRRGSGSVVVRAGPDAAVVAMGDEEDRIGACAGDDGDEVAQADAAESRDGLVPRVLAGSEPVEAELLFHPPGGPAGAR